MKLLLTKDYLKITLATILISKVLITVPTAHAEMVDNAKIITVDFCVNAELGFQETSVKRVSIILKGWNYILMNHIVNFYD